VKLSCSALWDSLLLDFSHNCDPQAHLFDRRHAGRYLHAEWGVPPDADSATTCVRRFGRHSRAKGERKGCEHVTGARMSAWNGHEVSCFCLISHYEGLLNARDRCCYVCPLT
jgi:hypothetical protein